MDFIRQFETYSTIQLLRIIDSPNDYQPNAVEAAKKIISSRQLSGEEFEIAKGVLDAEKREKEQKDKLKNIYKSFFDAVNPTHHGTFIPQNTIRLISIVLGGLFLFQLYRELELMYAIFFVESTDWDFFMLVYFLPLIFFATVIVLFYKRKKAGWFLLAIYLIFSAMSAIGMLIVFTKITRILTFILCAGITAVISKEDIRAIYSISEQAMLYTISIGILAMIVLLICYSVYSYGVIF